MRQTHIAIRVLIILVVLLASSQLVRSVQVHATKENKRPAAGRPGDAPYTPTKLEWAALELQARYGQHWTSETPVSREFLPLDDGRTVICLLQYLPELPPSAVNMDREMAQALFEKYATHRGWPWLRLQFQEKVLPRSTQ
jgi:hypothetical protein